jgi:hypothetical protein
MENISLSIISLRVNKEAAIAAQQTFLNKNPYFQREFESWDDKLKTRFIESMLLGRATNPIWTVLNKEEDSEEILDGMHRISTALSFLNNEFSLNKNYFSCLNENEYNKKKFQDLSPDDRAKFRNYSFVFNKLDSTYRDDTNKLKDMYEILNRSSKTLNDYEFNKVLLQPFYDIILPYKEKFIQIGLFDKAKDSRGYIDTEIIELLALTCELPHYWTSVNNLKSNWLKFNLGDTSEQVSTYLKENKESLIDILNLIVKIVDFFMKNDLFKKNIKKNTVKMTDILIYKFIIARCCYLTKTIALFNRASTNLLINFKEQIMNVDLQEKLKCNSRNATFQKKLTDLIDSIIMSETNNSTRIFSKQMITKKLEEQKGTCSICQLKINEKDTYEGDHIVSWTSGGQTVYNNLQVVHQRCHKLKN